MNNSKEVKLSVIMENGVDNQMPNVLEMDSNDEETEAKEEVNSNEKMENGKNRDVSFALNMMDGDEYVDAEPKERENYDIMEPDIDQPVIISNLTDETDSKRKQANTFAAKKTAAQGMMDIALITSNANQLRYILAFNNSPTFYLNLVLVSMSLILQIAVGMALIFKGRLDYRGESKDRPARITNNYVVIGVFLITIINVFVASFTTVDATTSTAPVISGAANNAV